jgi:hypothetical protein
MIVFIVAPPRSGTTFLYNLMCQENIGIYPSNILRIFKFNLKIGFMFQNFVKKFFKLNFTNKKKSYGVTKGILSPAESGYIFRKFIKLNNNELYKNIKKKDLNNLIIFLKSVSGKKIIILKNFYTIKYISYISKHFPYCKWIFINRNINETSLSFFKMRKSLKKKQVPIIYKEGYQDNFNKARLNTKIFKYFVKREKKKIKRKDFIEIEFKNLIANPSTNIKFIKDFLSNDLPKFF